jgi:benzoate transport
MSARPERADTVASRVIDHGPIRVQQGLVILLCMLINMIDGFDITAMAVVAADVGSELRIADDRIGWIFGFATAGMVAGAVLLAPLSDLVGRRTLILASLVLVGISVLLTARASGFAEFVALRFLSGAGAGAMLASQAALAAEYSPERLRALAVALVTSGYPAGAMLTSIAAGYIVPEHGWRGVFEFGGIVTLFMVAVAWLAIPESIKFLIERRPPSALERLNRIMRRLGEAPLAALPAPAPLDVAADTAGPRTLLDATHKRLTLGLWSAFFLSFGALYFLLSWLPKLMTDAGFDDDVARQSFFLFNLGGVLGIYMLGLLSAVVPLSRLVAAMLAAAACGMLAFAAAPAEPSLLLALVFVIGLLQQGGFTGLYGVAAKVYPTRVRATGVGWAIGLGRFGAVAGPVIAGYLIAAGLGMNASFLLFALPLAVSALLAARLAVR